MRQHNDDKCHYYDGSGIVCTGKAEFGRQEQQIKQICPDQEEEKPGEVFGQQTARPEVTTYPRLGLIA